MVPLIFPTKNDTFLLVKKWFSHEFFKLKGKHLGREGRLAIGFGDVIERVRYDMI